MSLIVPNIADTVHYWGKFPVFVTMLRASSHVLRFNRIFGFGEGQRSVNTSASRYQSETDNKQPADTRERGSTDSC